jgi:hypothetical protein
MFLDSNENVYEPYLRSQRAVCARIMHHSVGLMRGKRPSLCSSRPLHPHVLWGEGAHDAAALRHRPRLEARPSSPRPEGGARRAALPRLVGPVLPVARPAAGLKRDVRHAAVGGSARVGQHVARHPRRGVHLRPALGAPVGVREPPPRPGVKPGGAHRVHVPVHAQGRRVAHPFP